MILLPFSAKEVVIASNTMQAARGTFVRASFGQGYRFPTASELFVYTFRAGGRVYPNPKLIPESGFSAELGVKQAVKLKEWFAYFDLALFYSKYRNMIDYKIGRFRDPVDSSLGFGAQAQNIQTATIFGTEVSAYGQGKLFGVPLNFIIGYSYILPYETDSLKAGIKKDGNLFSAIGDKSVPILYFRNRHNFKADIEASYKGAFLGVSMVYTSYVENVDASAYGFAPGLFAYRTEHHTGAFIMDARVGYGFLKDHARISFICKNIFNKEYMLRAGFIEPPRNFATQFSYQF
jgi:outer membrane receptor protein involved in Fe transport